MRSSSSLKSFSVVLFNLILITFLVVGCKKNNIDETEPDITTQTPANGSRDQLTKDSIYLYAKEAYLWNDALPAYEVFNPRKYTMFSNELDNFNKELFDITQLKINPLTGKPYEFVSTSATYPKYSYITDEDSNNPTTSVASVPAISQVSLEGVGTDFGLALSAIGTQSSYQIYLRYVNEGSPADKNFLDRGDVLLEMNGRVLGSGFTNDQNFINSAFDQSSITLKGKKSDGTQFTRTLTKVTYNSSPVFKHTIISRNGKKIGYLAFARFSNITNAEAPLNQVFSEFATGLVTDLVIDLRYNGGGYVTTAEQLANLIAPSSLNGSVMFTEHFNTTLQTGKASILKNQPLLTSDGKFQYSNGKLVTYYDIDYSVANNTYKFAKKGNLNGISKVVFLVSENTASASELVINVLKPHLDVKLIGSATYGKPVGFFPITIDKYDVYFSMFESKNSNGEGGYYAGFTPNSTAPDDVTHDFGDPLEAQFAAAINYLVNGTLSAKAPVATIMGTKMAITSSDVKDLSNADSFKGMIETRYKLKK
ncbi:S41 family peptidase [Pedobacter sp. P351]|uniref:S41 family peptidase n=1 Tax=Pedobacter superstes TaxID=3133441 RepID=UPI0030A45E49